LIYTVGHSNLEADAFVGLLEGRNIKTLLDIRSHPGSHWPHFNKEQLEWLLNFHGIKYIWEPNLGGWRSGFEGKYTEMLKNAGVDISSYLGHKFPKQTIAKKVQPLDGQEQLVPTWTNQGLHHFAWFMATKEFLDAAQNLIDQTFDGHVAYMCSEVLWWKCHRSMVSDYLLYRGIDTVHLQPKRVEHSKVIGNRLERYPRAVIEAWRR
jgi:uncharacterized protein (DUF488 family)